MGGLGSMLHASQTIKNNWANRKALRKNRKKYAYATKHKKGEFNFPKVSEEELEKIKADIRAKGKKRRIIEYTIIAITIIIVIILFYVFSYYDKYYI